jgi:hypothetical protein
MSPICCYVPGSFLGWLASRHTDTSFWSTIAPGWVTAVATAGLLIGAVFTAVYAKRAFDGQTEQLKGQRKINALQAKDLEASLDERAALRRITEREQASGVSFYWWPAREVMILSRARGSPWSHLGHDRGVNPAGPPASLAAGCARDCRIRRAARSGHVDLSADFPFIAARSAAKPDHGVLGRNYFGADIEHRVSYDEAAAHQSSRSGQSTSASLATACELVR